jgi:Fimbrial assembly protein (PilN)
MRRLELDFQRLPRPSRIVQAVLLAIALAFAADVGRSYLQARKDVESLRERLTHAARPESERPLIKVVAQPVTEQELDLARETIRRLSTPWEALFKSLEAARIERVTITSVEPDPVARTVSIEGEARDYLSALSYVANLRQQRALKRVLLVHHETGGQSAQRPLRFVISASWGTRE